MNLSDVSYITILDRPLLHKYITHNRQIPEAFTRRKIECDVAFLQCAHNSDLGLIITGINRKTVDNLGKARSKPILVCVCFYFIRNRDYRKVDDRASILKLFLVLVSVFLRIRSAGDSINDPDSIF
jgi:hypothetical protein